MNQNKSILITGSAQGIGAATALAAAKRGIHVCIHYNCSKNLAENLALEVEKLGVDALVCQADLSKKSDLENLFKLIDQNLPPLGYFVNNAAATGPRKSFEDLEAKEIEDVFATNFFGATYCLQQAIKRMKAGKQGSIVNISSQVATFGGNQLSAYAASKGAMNSLTVALAKELGKFNIRINAVSPGVIQTTQHADKSTEWIDQIQKQIPLGRLGKPEEIANVILWLLSEEASFMNGAIVPVTGGR